MSLSTTTTMTTTTIPKKLTTTVNGIGMWHSWRRNFKTPFYAMLDLVDNAIDAALGMKDESDFVGRVEIYENFISVEESIKNDDDDDNDNNITNAAPSDDDNNDENDPDPVIQMLQEREKQQKDAEKEKTKRISELVVVNNSLNKICPLQEILEIHKSAKGKDAYSKSEAIGENGVGLKQGCAAISNLSFVFVRNSDDYDQDSLSFGIIAKSLQHEEGCYLPAFEIDIEKGVSEHLTELLNYKDMGSIAECVEEYGGTKENGIRMLSRHMQEMIDPTTKWGSSDHVFKLVITDVLDIDTASDNGVLILDINESENSSSSMYSRRRRSSSGRLKETNPSHFKNLIGDVEMQLPRYYIHIPDNFNILINHKSITFNFWQRRMVELMKFHQKIEEDESFIDSKEITEPSSSSTTFRVFCGFDPIRLKDEKQQSALSLYIYSRHSGRLIKHEPDARNLLGLTAGGTDYAQGLTCIIDDFSGKIPLNPTKQDVAFSEKRNGEIMGKNLYAWVGGIVQLYYKFNLNRKFVYKRKGDLTEELKLHHETVIDEFHRNRGKKRKLKSLAEADLSTIVGMKWRKVKDTIRANLVDTVYQVCGNDTMFSIKGDDPGQKTTKAKKTSVKRKVSAITSKSAPKAKRTRTKAAPRTRAKPKKAVKTDMISIESSESVESLNQEISDDEFDLQPSSNEVSDEQVQDLMQQLQREKNMNAKQKHDHSILIENLRKEHDREIDLLKSELQENQGKESQQLTQPELIPIKRDEDYEMMEEVKNNLLDENERLEEERVSLIEERDFLSRKLKVLETKLQAEKAVRVTQEEEIEILKKELERKNAKN